MVLNHLPGNTGDVGCLPRKHVDIRPQEGDEREFLFTFEGGAYSESPSRAILPNGHLLGLWWLSSRFLALAGRAFWHVLDGSTTLRGCALAGVGVRGLAGLLLKEICPRGNNKVLYISLYHDKCLLFMLELY